MPRNSEREVIGKTPLEKVILWKKKLFFFFFFTVRIVAFNLLKSTWILLLQVV